MKLYLRHICLVLLTLMVCQAARAGTETATRSYDTSLIKTDEVKGDDGSYTRIEWEGLSFTSEPGAPALPVEYIRFIVPIYTNNFRASISKVALGTSQKLDNPVMPAQTPVSTNHIGDIPFTLPNPDFYAIETGIRAEVMDDGYLDGCNHVVTVAVYPMACSANGTVITAASRMSVVLDYDECAAEEVNGTPILPPHRSKYLDLESLVVNSQRLASAKYAPIEDWQPEQPEYYYIITSRELEPAFDDLARWKRQKGYNVVVKTMEEICKQYPVGTTHYCSNPGSRHAVELVDSAASLRAYLQDEFAAHSSFFCLLAGDWNTSVPIRKANRENFYLLDDEVEDPDNSNFVPTDNYFSDLTTDYVMHKATKADIQVFDSGKYTYQPDIILGRLLCHDAKEVEIYFHKLKLYEAYPGYGDSNYLDNAFFFTQNEMNEEDEGALKFNNPFTHVEVQKDNASVGILDAGPKGAETISKISKSGFSSWHGHGNPIGVACADGIYFITSLDEYEKDIPTGYAKVEPYNGLNNLTNKDKPGIAYSISCDLTPYTDRFVFLEHYGIYWINPAGYVFHIYDNHKYDMTTSYTIGGNYGGVAIIANTRNGLTGSSAELEAQFIKGLKYDQHIGIAQNYSKNNFTYNYLKETCNLIGDPEIEMWLRKPQTMSLKISQERTNLSIMGDDCTDAKICAYTEGNNPILLNSTNCENYQLPYLFREYCISVWKTGFLPYIRLIANSGKIADANRKYIVRDAEIGKSSNADLKYTVEDGGILTIDALDNISLGKGLEIKSGGVLEIKCDRDAYLEGFTVQNGGKLIVTAKNIRLGAGFKVEKGGKLEINYKR